MQNMKVQVINSDNPIDFENYLNRILTDLDLAGQEYQLSFNGPDKYCAYITYSKPKIKTLIKDDDKRKYCIRECDYCRVKSDATVYCSHHEKVIKYGGLCCLEFYEGGL